MRSKQYKVPHTHTKHFKHDTLKVDWNNEIGVRKTEWLPKSIQQLYRHSHTHSTHTHVINDRKCLTPIPNFRVWLKSVVTIKKNPKKEIEYIWWKIFVNEFVTPNEYEYLTLLGSGSSMKCVPKLEIKFMCSKKK